MAISRRFSPTKRRGLSSGIGCVYAATALAALVLAGCSSPPSQRELDLAQDAQDANDQVRLLRRENAELQAQAKQLQDQVQTLQHIGGKRIDALHPAVRIALGDRTSGSNTDANNGDDAIEVFVIAYDAQGSAVKAAGALQVRLFDLAAEANQVLLAEFESPADKLGQCWRSGMFGGHYRLTCDLPDRVEHSEITVRATFTDYVTGKTLTAEKRVTISLPHP